MSLPEPSNVLTLDGQIDFHRSPRLASSLQTMMETKPVRVVVDLGGVTYIDSSGLAVLIQAMQEIEAYGGRFMLASVPKNLGDIFESAGLGQFFLTFPHVDAALAAI